MFLFTFTMWLLEKFNYICSSHYILLSDAALQLGKAISKASSWRLPGKAAFRIPTEFHSTSATEECLLPRQSWVPEPTQGGLTHFSPIPHASCSLPGSFKPANEPNVATKPAAPSSKPQLSSCLEPRRCVGICPASLSPSQQPPGMWLPCPRP